MTFGEAPFGGAYFGGRPGLRVRVGRSVALAWLTRSRAGSSTAVGWSTRVAAGRSVVVQWRTLALVVGSAGRSVALAWRTRAAAGRSVAVAWQVLTRPPRDLRATAGGAYRARGRSTGALPGPVDAGVTAGRWRAGGPTREVD